jgi:hypothetical protein
MNLIEFLSGICMATFAASGVFFFKFYRGSRDRFFLFFGLACWLLALERVVLLSYEIAFQSIRTVATEGASWVFTIRLLAFLLILAGIVDKNRRTTD